MNLPAIPVLLVALLLADSAALMEGSTTTFSTSSPTTPTSPSSPSNETQPLLLQSSPPPPQPSLLPQQPADVTSLPSLLSSSTPPSEPPIIPTTNSSATSTESMYWGLTTTTTASPSIMSTTEIPATTDSVYWWLAPSTSATSTCPESDQIHCGNSDRCTRIRYICDGDNDCGDGTDESSTLCRAWRNNDCDRNLAQCNRLGRSDCVTISNYCTLTDPPCEGTLDMRLCVMLRDGKIQPLHQLQLPTTTSITSTAPTTHLPLHVMEQMWNDDFEEKLTHTISHPDCPQLYTRIGNLCLSVFFIGNMTWLESRAFCRAIGGDLFTLGKNLTSFTTLVQHLAVNGVTADFWIGGRYINETEGWKWVDDTPLAMGSPFWAVRYNEACSTRLIPYLNRTLPANEGACYHYQQAPEMPSTRHCVASTYQHYFYLSDENCFSKKSPLCVMPGEKKKQQAH